MSFVLLLMCMWLPECPAGCPWWKASVFEKWEILQMSLLFQALKHDKQSGMCLYEDIGVLGFWHPEILLYGLAKQRENICEVTGSRRHLSKKWQIHVVAVTLCSVDFFPIKTFHYVAYSFNAWLRFTTLIFWFLASFSHSYMYLLFTSLALCLRVLQDREDHCLF